MRHSNFSRTGERTGGGQTRSITPPTLSTQVPSSSSALADTPIEPDERHPVAPTRSPPQLASPIGSPADSTSHHPSAISSAALSSSSGGLLRLYLINKKIMPSNKCSHQITRIFKKKIHPDGISWKGVPDDYKDMYFEELKKYCTWDESIDGLVYEAWLEKAADRYSELIYGWKNKRATEKPPSVPEDVWRRWLLHWEKPDVIEKSEKNRNNRKKEKHGPGTGIARHTGGSKSFIEHKEAMTEELGRTPDAFELFERTHKRKDGGQFVDEQSKRVADVVKQKLKDATERADGSSEPSQPVDMNQLYLDAVGGSKKQRIYGLGCLAGSFMPKASSSTSPSVDVDELRRQIREEVREEVLQDRARTDEELARQQQKLDQQTQQLDQMKLLVDNLMQQLSQQGMVVLRPDETHPSGSSANGGRVGGSTS